MGKQRVVKHKRSKEYIGENKSKKCEAINQY